MEDNSKVFLGTEMKLNIHIEPIESNAGNITMDDYDFDVIVYCNPKKQLEASKKGIGENPTLVNMKRLNSNNYLVLIDTNIIETGTIKCKITAYIPDSHFGDGYRTEVSIKDTGIEVVKSL